MTSPFVMPRIDCTLPVFLESFRFLGIFCFSAYDPQASLTISLGFPKPDQLPMTLSDVMSAAMMDQPVNVQDAILQHWEKVDILPSSIELSGLEVSLVNAMSRETILKQALEPLKRQYDYILIDCMPSLGMDSEQATPSLSQAQRLKRFSQEGRLSIDVMRAIMSEEKKSDLDNITIPMDSIRKFFPKSYTPKQIQDTIMKLVESWYKKMQRRHER